jgi:hypothetical protein
MNATPMASVPRRMLRFMTGVSPIPGGGRTPNYRRRFRAANTRSSEVPPERMGVRTARYRSVTWQDFFAVEPILGRRRYEATRRTPPLDTCQLLPYSFR